jgi:Amidohydrolase family
VDQGDEPAGTAAGTLLFVPIESSPAYSGQMLAALVARGLRAPAPGGTTLVAEKLAVLPMKASDGAGSAVNAALYAVTGGDSNPWYLWLFDDGSARLFGLVFPGWAVLPKGFETNAAAMLERQRQAQDERLIALQKRLAQPLPGLTRIHNVRWFDSHAALMRGPSDVYLFEGRISAITAPGAVKAEPQQSVDGSGRTLLPGLFDMHGHLWPGAALMHLAGGATSVRDLANQNADLWLMKNRIDRGELAGPHIHPAGLIEGQSPFSLRAGIVAASEDQALAAVDWYAARGYRQLKLYNSIKPEWVRAITQRAHAQGLTVAGHVPAFMRAEEAVQAGYDELTHINQVMLNFFVKPQDDTRTLLRFTLVGDEARKVDPQGAAAQRFIALLKKHKVSVDPTLATFEGMFKQRNGEANPSLGTIAEHLPVLWRRGLRSAEMGPTAEQVQRYRASFDSMLRLVGQMHRAGVPLLAGTDATPGLMLHRELELYQQAGIPPLQVLQIATRNAARALGVLGDKGSIERGRQADLLLVEGDPASNVGDVRKASLVIKAGVAYAPAQIYEALGIRPFAGTASIERHNPAR